MLARRSPKGGGWSKPERMPEKQLRNPNAEGPALDGTKPERIKKSECPNFAVRGDSSFVIRISSFISHS